MGAYNIQFKKLCNDLHLGDLIATPRPVPGGLLHRMFSVETSQGRYAIKALNPQIMLRPNVMQNIILSERIGAIAASTVPAIPARILNGNIIHEIDGQFYIVFDWIEGKSKNQNEIVMTHCEKMGAILADIHTIDFSEFDLDNVSDYSRNIDWNNYLQKGFANNAVWSDRLAEHLDDLYLWTDRANQAAQRLVSDRIISHRDLDPKNVLWNERVPYIIDWESAGHINPAQEMTETAIYWSSDENGGVDKDKFMAFVRAYKTKCPARKDWSTALDNGFIGKLEWLEYNLKRSLWIECSDQEEQQMGTSQVSKTIGAITRYAEMIPLLVRWLTQTFDD